MNNLSFYLGGCLTYHHKQNQFHLATIWRSIFERWADDNGLSTFNPATTFQQEQTHKYSPKSCVDQNRHYLNKSDIMIVDLNCIQESPGTQWELTYASEVKKIPIIAFGDVHWSPHIMNSITHVCSDIEDVIEYICNMYGETLKYSRC